MPTCINAYSERKTKGAWVATEKETFNEEKPNRFGWVNASMSMVTCPENYEFYGLLLDGVRNTWPWSFPPKGMPADASEEVRSVCDSFSFEAYGHSYLTLRELVEKYLELMVSGTDAKQLMGYLRVLIDNIPKRADDQDDVRIVFWFDG